MTIINSLIRGANRHIELVDIASVVSPHYPAIVMLTDVISGNNSSVDESLRPRASPFGCPCDTGVL